LDANGLDYIPHVHVDSVIGWAWLFFKDYDFRKNPLNFTEEALSELDWGYKAISNIFLADSFGADFHKTGFTHYLSSLIVVKNKQKLYSLGDETQAALHELEFGLYAPFTYTLESSRSATSALSAWLSLKQLGVEGYQRIIGTLVESGCNLRKHFNQTGYSRCANETAHGFAALTLLYPVDMRYMIDDSLEKLTEIQLYRIAKYNYKFYLYMLSLQAKNKISFALDYVSKHTEISGVKLGVIKLFPMSPFCDAAFLSDFYTKFDALLSKYDKIWESIELEDSPYRPKPFVTR
jgi:glutamate/tyrosine decarboxylase-like PLP-dependent enzyme